MKQPPDMPGLSHKRLRALNDALREADLKTCSDKLRKEYEAKCEAAAALAPARGARPKRKRARRGGVSGRAGAGADEPDWPFSDRTIEAMAQMIERRVTRRLMAQQARQAGDPTARPRNFR